jgi:xanthine dehydrogenase iron-sulfur cluster and FAD-binding subunit A
MKIEFNVNGRNRAIEVDPRETLLVVLREHLGLRGAKYGCGEGECGACTIIFDGYSANSCLILAGQAHGARILTIEGMEEDVIGKLLLDCFPRLGAVQCGFCTPGFILSARSLLSEEPFPSTTDIKEALAGNLCRCTGYVKIIDAVMEAASLAQGMNTSVRDEPTLVAPLKSENFIRSTNIEEALEILSEDESWKILGGGTDLTVMHKQCLKDLRWLDISSLPEIQGIHEGKDYIRIGGETRYTDLIYSDICRKWCSVLVEACKRVGSRQIRNRGAIAGNIVNASPAADLIPALLVLESEILLRSRDGERRIPIKDFVLGPGKVGLRKGEILTEVIIPKVQEQGDEVFFFEKCGARRAHTIAIASVALRGWLDGGRLSNVKVALGAVAPTAILTHETANHLMNGSLSEKRVLRAGYIASNACSPIDDIRGTAAYRRRLVRGLLVRGLWPYLEMK